MMQQSIHARRNLFIHADNQKMLWNIVSNIPDIGKLGDGSMQYRQEWFRRLVQGIYETRPDMGSDPQTLKTLNKEFVQIAMQQLQSNMYPKPPSSVYTHHNQISAPAPVPGAVGPGISTDYYNSDAERMRKANQFNEAFGNRQREFDIFMAKPAPPKEVNFLEKLDDEPIGDINALIERHKQERERELQTIHPLSGITNQTTPPPAPLPPRISISGDIKTVLPTHDITNIRPTLSVPADTNKKVSWSNTLTESDQDSITSLRTKYNDLEQKYNEMRNTVDEMKKQLDMIMAVRSEPVESSPEKDISAIST